MVAGFRRSMSLTGPNTTTGTTQSNQEKAYHVRSTSLPTRSHPLISQIGSEVRSLRLWQTEQSNGATWLTYGLTRVEQLLQITLDDLLHLQQTQDSLRRYRRSPWVESLLDDFLRFADAYGCFRESLVSLQQLQSAAQSAVRRRDQAKLTPNLRGQKKVEKEMLKLVSSLREIGKTQEPILFSDSSEAELAGIMREVKVAVASASASVFSGLVTLSSTSGCTSSSSSSSSSSSFSSWTMLKKRLTLTSATNKKTEEEWEVCLEGLKEMERCIEGLENGSEKVFRCLIHTRVALLNILTP